MSDPMTADAASRRLVVLVNGLPAAAAPLVNYQNRRQALENWSIDKGTWAALAGRLPPVPGPQRPELGDRKRQIASVYVWTQVTSGEHYFAPARSRQPSLTRSRKPGKSGGTPSVT